MAAVSNYTYPDSTPRPAEDQGIHSILVPNATTVTDSQGSHQTAYDKDLAQVEIAILSTIFTLALLGNGLVLLSLVRKKGQLHRMQVMICHLCVADIFVAFFNVLPQLIWDVTFQFIGNDGLCRFVKYVQVLGMFASSYVLVTTAVDRYLAICHPLTSHIWNDSRIHVYVSIAWVLAAVFSTPQAFIFSLGEQSEFGVYNCLATFNPKWTLQAYVTWTSCAIYIIPSLVLAVLYTKICCRVWQSFSLQQPRTSLQMVRLRKLSNRNGEPQNAMINPTNEYSTTRLVRSQTDNYTLQYSSARENCRNSVGTPRRDDTNASHRSIARRTLRTVKLTLTVVTCYFICWSPFFIGNLWAAWDPTAPYEGTSMVVVMLLASLNSCTNPWIYLAYNETLCGLTCKAKAAKLKRTSTFSSSKVTTATKTYVNMNGSNNVAHM